MYESKRKKKVVVLGAGYAGLTAVKRLDIKGTDNEIILVDFSNHAELIQHAHLVVGGIKGVEEVRFPINKIIENTSIKFIQSYVQMVKAEEKQVVLQDRKIPFDLLVVALGAKTQSFGIEGVTRFAFTLHSIDDALRIKTKIQQLINEPVNSYLNSSNEEKEKDKKIKNVKQIIIVGGGPTGVATAGTIGELLVRLGKKDEIKITVVSASPTILPGSDKIMIREATKILRTRNIEILTHSLVSDVDKDKVILNDGRHIYSSITIWTPGVRGYELPFEPEVEKTKDGRIVVNEFCQINDFPEIFCIGDIGAIKDNSDKIKDATLGQTAISEAIYLARIISEILSGKKPQEKFQYKPRINILPMGSNDYIGTVDGHFIKGDIARILKEFRNKSFEREISMDKTVINDILYKDDPLANILLGISIGSALSNTSVLPNQNDDKKNMDLENKITEIVDETKEVSKEIPDR